MPENYRVLFISYFERDIKLYLKKNKIVIKLLAKAKEILEDDPYNLTKKHNIKKLYGIKSGEGEFRIRLNNFRLRYDIFKKDVVLYSFRHRKDVYK